MFRLNNKTVTMIRSDRAFWMRMRSCCGTGTRVSYHASSSHALATTTTTTQQRRPDNKRPLQESQLKGPSSTVSTTKMKTPSPPIPPPPINSTSSSSINSSSSSNNQGALWGGLAVLSVAGAGGAYYYYSSSSSSSSSSSNTKQTATTTDKAHKKDATTKQPTIDPNDAPHRVTAIDMPLTMKNTAAAMTSVSAASSASQQHPVDGHRVLMTPPKSRHPQGSPTKDDRDVAAADDNDDDLAVTNRALAALQTSMSAAATEALLASHPTMWTATSMTAASSAAPLGDLDQLTEAQLKGRIVQLASELQNRTKWEALRLKEFLAMKEQEVAAEYTKLMQKQRMEFEDLLAQRLREQESAWRAQLDAALREKDANIQTLLHSSLEAQAQELQHEKEEFTKVTRAEVQAQLEETYATQMQTLKEQTTADLQAKVDALEALSNKVAQLQQALANTKTHQAGSLQAHRLSAAALQLSETLATDKPAGAEIAALSAVAGPDGGVIATAVATIPRTVHIDRVPTLAQLQTWFEDIHGKVRQAALVPAGTPGLEGQIAGRLWAMITSAPSPAEADADVKADPSSSEFILAKARRCVQMGDLTAALDWLEKLPSAGQVALTVADWKAATVNRILVDKAIKVIKMECALLNESLAD